MSKKKPRKVPSLAMNVPLRIGLAMLKTHAYSWNERPCAAKLAHPLGLARKSASAIWDGRCSKASRAQFPKMPEAEGRWHGMQTFHHGGRREAARPNVRPCLWGAATEPSKARLRRDFAKKKGFIEKSSAPRSQNVAPAHGNPTDRLCKTDGRGTHRRPNPRNYLAHPRPNFEEKGKTPPGVGGPVEGQLHLGKFRPPAFPQSAETVRAETCPDSRSRKGISRQLYRTHNRMVFSESAIGPCAVLGSASTSARPQKTLTIYRDQHSGQNLTTRIPNGWTVGPERVHRLRGIDICGATCRRGDKCERGRSRRVKPRTRR